MLQGHHSSLLPCHKQVTDSPIETVTALYRALAMGSWRRYPPLLSQRKKCYRQQCSAPLLSGVRKGMTQNRGSTVGPRFIVGHSAKRTIR